MDDSWEFLNNRLCPECGGVLKKYFDHVECVCCEYREFLYNLNKVNTSWHNTDKLIINSSGTGVAYGGINPEDLISKTLSIDCELIALHHKELDIEFELDTKKLENINTIEINGHRFVREKK